MKSNPDICEDCEYFVTKNNKKKTNKCKLDGQTLDLRYPRPLYCPLIQNPEGDQKSESKV